MTCDTMLFGAKYRERRKNDALLVSVFTLFTHLCKAKRLKNMVLDRNQRQDTEARNNKKKKTLLIKPAKKIKT